RALSRRSHRATRGCAVRARSDARRGGLLRRIQHRASGHGAGDRRTDTEVQIPEVQSMKVRCSIHFAASLALVAAVASPLAAQQPPVTRDSVVTLDELVVTADRAGSALGSSVASVSVVTAPQLAHTPQLTLADALRHVPGFALIGFDGLGHDPQ